MWSLVLVAVLIILYFYYTRQKFTEQSRALFGNIQPICVPCGSLLPTQRNDRCPTDPTMCAYPGLNQSGHPADVYRVTNILNQQGNVNNRPVLPKIFESMLESIESFCGYPQQTFIDAPNPIRLNDKDQLLSAAASGY